jgi:hypothetical protein
VSHERVGAKGRLHPMLTFRLIGSMVGCGAIPPEAMARPERLLWVEGLNRYRGNL